MDATMKPLGRKSYGSIPHLPGSRTGPADHTIGAGQAAICTERTRNCSDTIVLQEKLDGSNVAVARIGDDVIALGRAGYLASTSRYEMHHRFAAWVEERRDRFMRLLLPGERVCGEWLAQAHGTIYAPMPEEMLFRPFDIICGNERETAVRVAVRCEACDLWPVATLNIGGPVSVKRALKLLERSCYSLPTWDGSPREGCVWRVERFDADLGISTVDFLAKYVRPEKVDGLYLKSDAPIWAETY